MKIFSATGAALAIAFTLALHSTTGSAKQPPNLKPNRIRIAYVAPSNPAHEEIYRQLQERRVLERFKDYLSPVRLPHTLVLKTAGCDGESNAWYEESDHAVTVCYEYLADVLRNAPDTTTAGGVTRQDAIIGPTVEVFLHETGHALFAELRVPVFGQEEDAADQLAAYLMLHLEQDVAQQTVRGVAYMYNREMQSQNPGLAQFADVHGLSAQRFYNLLCMAYGSDSKTYAMIVEKGYLPESRADGCEDEYKQVDYAFKRLISPYVDEALRKKMKARKPLRPMTPKQ